MRAEGFVPQRRKVAAALSAAVTTTQLQEYALNSQAEPSKRKRPNSNASRSSGGSAREGLLSEKPPPSHTSHVPYSQLLFGRGGLGERRFS